ncbi:MAG: Uncharacterized protein FD162_737 [Rhodobacteraceae bacterium]|uniref:hypothetical protein n=1 Tax=Cypionkella sp. TaxID=2811411 RepID=UPI00132980ED|nr:hypothetical protein [Cypionkella sp.]KAF0175016.1 MAG: Uncharacterized protein FD162_737 [Paracoccaceae bacterium]MDO8325492.1 hypothetical protein [Cypionkella sp.]
MPQPMIASETLAETIHALRHARHVPMFAMKRQANRLLAAVIAVSLLAASALPSHADKRGDNIAKLLAGALAVGLIANSIDNNKARATPAPAPQPQPQPTGLPRVPSVCAISIDSNSGDAVTMYPEKCLRREGFSYGLPACARPARIFGEADKIYSANCLQDAGFKLGR